MSTPLTSNPPGTGNLPSTVSNLEEFVRAVDKMDIPALAGGGGGGSLPSWLANSPDAPPTSPGAYDELWDDETYSGVQMSGPINGLNTSRWVAFGAAKTYGFANNCLVLTGTAAAGITPNIGGIAIPQPATPYTVTTKATVNRSNNYNISMLGFINGSNAVVSIGIYVDVWITKLLWEYYSNPTTLVSQSSIISADIKTAYLQITNDGSNLIMRWSPNGVAGSFEQLGSVSYGASITPSHFAIMTNPFSANTPVATFGQVVVT